MPEQTAQEVAAVFKGLLEILKERKCELDPSLWVSNALLIRQYVGDEPLTVDFAYDIVKQHASEFHWRTPPASVLAAKQEFQQSSTPVDGIRYRHGEQKVATPPKPKDEEVLGAIKRAIAHHSSHNIHSVAENRQYQLNSLFDELKAQGTPLPQILAAVNRKGESFD